MANPIIGAATNGFTPRTTAGASSNTFLGYSAKSPVQQLVEAQKAVTSRTTYEDTEDFMRMKAFELSNRIKLMDRMGQTEAVNALRVEANALVQKYLKFQKQAEADAAAKKLEDQVNAKFGLNTKA